MSSYFTGILVGMFIGAFIGYIFCALMVIAKKADDRAERNEM